MVGDRQFEIILGHSIPDGKWSGELELNDSICQMYYAKSFLARFIYRILDHIKKKSEENGKPDLNILFIYNMPLRAISKMSGGMVSERMVDDIVYLVNGHFWRGLGRLIVSFFRNLKQSKEFEKKLS